MGTSPQNKNLIGLHSRMIESYLCSYLGYTPSQSSSDYVTSLSYEFLEEACPSVLDLPASLIVQENGDTAHVSIHLRGDIFELLDQNSIDQNFMTSNEGLSAFLILTEEISHFFYYLRHAESQTTVSRLEMEIQAELDKIIVASLVLANLCGKPQVRFLTQKIFVESQIHGDLTNYKPASKIAEKFWRRHLEILGDNILAHAGFRRFVQQISHKSGPNKQKIIFEDELNSAA